MMSWFSWPECKLQEGDLIRIEAETLGSHGWTRHEQMILLLENHKIKDSNYLILGEFWTYQDMDVKAIGQFDSATYTPDENTKIKITLVSRPKQKFMPK